MVCSGCQRSDETLIKAFVSSFHQHDRDSLSSCHLLCQQCIIGNTLPVCRPSTNRWQMGEMAEFNAETGQHHVWFLDDSAEWVTVAHSPFEDYVSYHRGRARARQLESSIQPYPLYTLDRNGDKSIMQPDDCGENGRLLQRALKQIVANGSEDYTAEDHADWSRRHITEKSGSSPQKGLSCRQKGGENATAAWRMSMSDENNVASDRDVHSPPRETANVDNARNAVGSESTVATRTTKQASPRMWTYEEDKQLLKCVESIASDTIKWSVIAESIPGRSGKQCRERYLNHLKPKLNVEGWTPIEDALLFQMYTSNGSKWAMMTKVLHGRTDNAIKNRFHHLCRRLDKDAAKLLKHISASEMKSRVLVETNKNRATETKNTCEMVRNKIGHMLPCLAVETTKKGESTSSFGPFRKAQGDVCKRCSLLGPSLQTGKFVCESSGWCEACTRLPPYVSGSTVRDCLSLRKAGSISSTNSM